MAVGIVDVLEMVNVHHADTRRHLVALGPFAFVLHHLEGMASIRQLGEFVMACELVVALHGRAQFALLYT